MKSINRISKERLSLIQLVFVIGLLCKSNPKSWLELLDILYLFPP